MEYSAVKHRSTCLRQIGLSGENVSAEDCEVRGRYCKSVLLDGVCDIIGASAIGLLDYNPNITV
jgi:hypothetical protein